MKGLLVFAAGFVLGAAAVGTFIACWFDIEDTRRQGELTDRLSSVVRFQWVV